MTRLEEDEERRRREASLQGSASLPGSSGDVAVDTVASGEQLQRDGPLAEGSQPGRVRKAPGIDTPQGRALSILRRLSFGMNRCVAKSNGEMAYHLLYEQEQYVTYRGYNMFFRFVPYAIMKCRANAIAEAQRQSPHLQATPLDVIEEVADDQVVPLTEFAEVIDVDNPGVDGEKVVVTFNQKDDYLHRGTSVLLRCMSLVTYSRFVRRVERAKAGRVDGVQFFNFEEHYAHYHSSVQDGFCVCMYVCMYV